MFLKAGWILIVGSAAFGFFVWLSIELTDKYLIPETKLNIDSSEMQPSEVLSSSAFIEIYHVPQYYPPSFLVKKSPISREWLVFVDNQPLASFPQLGKVQVSLSPGPHEIFVGFENNDSIWKRAQRSNRITVDLLEGQTCTYRLRANTKFMVIQQLEGLVFMMLFVTQRLWLFPILSTIPDTFWNTYPTLAEAFFFCLNYSIFAIILGAAFIAYQFHLTFNKQGMLLILEPVTTTRNQ